MSKTTLSFLLVALMLVLGFGSFTALVLYGHWCRANGCRPQGPALPPEGRRCE